MRTRAKVVVHNNRIPCGWKYAHENVWSSWFDYLLQRQ